MPPRNQHRKRIEKRQKEFVEDLNMGEFAGHFMLEWTGPESFNYHPDATDPFRYIRKKSNGKSEIIQPGPMITDGGSIPLIAQIVTGRTPWEYGPAYLIHDWEFYRHDTDTGFRKSFNQVNLTLAEAIWTLMNNGYLKYRKPVKNYKNVHTIYSGVMSPIGRAIWDDK
jgi:hypothetical protein